MNGRIVVAIGDITGFEGDAVVNAANSALAGGGGVDGAIHRAAEPELAEACRRLRAGPWKDGLPAGRAAATEAGRLPVRGVIHTVGPIWRGGASGEAGLLASAYRESLKIATCRGWGRVAFPAISTGVYGYPKAAAALVAFGTISEYLSAESVPETAWLVFFSRADADAFASAVAGSGPHGPEEPV
ncbi:MAG: O-acetyl-ADP-ribose deacetylase [Spirochaetes bacterium]|nr:O-acetyl-ADP-ribose deacetylase [Spirochaetota bacterium]MBU1079393.1 O-acetyl-ADP-ribose deacetylase [Spirochaetota bacterium]